MKVIAHRGASAYLPEHTLESKAMAHALGADYLEQDLVASRDGHLLVLHDIHLDRVTDVATQYPERARPDGRFYALDFDLKELRELNAHERVTAEGQAVYPQRFPVNATAKVPFRLHTFEEELALIHGLNRSTGRSAGIYPEIKRPAWHREQGTDISALVLDTLGAFDYSTRRQNLYVQCFDANELRRIREDMRSDLPLIQLIGMNAWGESPTDFEALLTPAGLEASAAVVDGFGPWIPLLYHLDERGNPRSSGTVETMHALNRPVHPYTARRDDLPPGFESFGQLLDFLQQKLAVEAVFSDFPDAARHAAAPSDSS